MKTIILPGYSPRNKDWALELKKQLQGDVIVHEWEHWGGGSMSATREMERITKETEGETLSIIAKSVGTRMTMHFLLRKLNRIEKIILCGIPSVSEENAELFRKALERFDTRNIIVFQNENDPFATYEEIKEYLGKVNPDIKVVKKPGSTHDYPYSGDFRKFLR